MYFIYESRAPGLLLVIQLGLDEVRSFPASIKFIKAECAGQPVSAAAIAALGIGARLPIALHKNGGPRASPTLPGCWGAA